jgi:hypothetical protein
LWQARFFSCVVAPKYFWATIAYMTEAEQYGWSSALSHVTATDADLTSDGGNRVENIRQSDEKTCCETRSMPKRIANAFERLRHVAARLARCILDASGIDIGPAAHAKPGRPPEETGRPCRILIQYSTEIVIAYTVPAFPRGKETLFQIDVRSETKESPARASRNDCVYLLHYSLKFASKKYASDDEVRANGAKNVGDSSKVERQSCDNAINLNGGVSSSAVSTA